MCTTCGCGEGNLYIEGDEHNPHSAFRSAPFAPAARPKMKITGIKAPEFTPSQTEEGDLHYGHGEAGTHAPGMSQRRMLEVEIDVLNATARALLPASNWCSTWFPALVPVKPPC